MDRGRATCGGQKPTAPTTRLIRGHGLRINAYYASWLRSSLTFLEQKEGVLRHDAAESRQRAGLRRFAPRH
jgi:hypothetical protein